jgi:hypothetical protein
MSNPEIADIIITHLEDYKGFGNWWNNIDPEDQDEILENLGQAVRDNVTF